ncbi:MAG TPA: alpha/beta hydrolase [Pseudonocardia sp.]|jgi:pimeloyl-ACP methyl ester carboxylesterase|uniref:alpha/beta fold hydrolase n=1 Tax=Pseudonocardia sp. TaxID=60912 RepID=UPI002ED7C331
MEQVELTQGAVRYTDTGGRGPVVVLVHGLLVNGSLWRDVVGPVSRHARVVVPELPLGSHRLPMRPDADLSPPGLARLVADLLEALDLREVTLVGNDTGGAICQLVATRHPERLARLVLTNCDAYRNFLPPAFRPLQLLPRIPGALWLTAQTMRSRLVRKIGFGPLARTGIDAERLADWVQPVLEDARVRRDVAKVLRGISVRYTLEAAERLREFDRPALLAWGRPDPFFKPAFAERLASDIPGARLAWIDDSATFVPVDAPKELAELIVDFVQNGKKGADRLVG